MHDSVHKIPISDHILSFIQAIPKTTVVMEFNELFGKQRAKIRRTVVPPSSSSSSLKMKAACSSEALVLVYQTTRLQIPEYRDLNIHNREKIKSQTILIHLCVFFA
jgi:hypothetical protein